MLTHDTIWLAIDRLAQRCGYSTSGLAKKAGLDPTSFNRSKRIGADGKPRWPSTESIARILSATDSTMADFIGLISTASTTVRTHSRIPVIATHQAEHSDVFDESGNPKGEGWDYIHFPYAPDEGLMMYALEVTGNGMLPLFREGDRLIIAPNAPVRRGDRVVVKTISGALHAKELARQTGGKVELKSLHLAEADDILAAKDILWMSRIVWVSQ